MHVAWTVWREPLRTENERADGDAHLITTATFVPPSAISGYPHDLGNRRADDFAGPVRRAAGQPDKLIRRDATHAPGPWPLWQTRLQGPLGWPGVREKQFFLHWGRRSVWLVSASARACSSSRLRPRAPANRATVRNAGVATRPPSRLRTVSMATDDSRARSGAERRHSWRRAAMSTPKRRPCSRSSTDVALRPTPITIHVFLSQR